MKKGLLLFVLALTILLSSCSPPTVTKNEMNTPFPRAEAWTSEGGAFKQTVFDAPDGVLSVFSNGSEVYSIVSLIDDSGSVALEVFHNSEVIYAPGGTSIVCADSAPEGVWILESFLVGGIATSGFKLISSIGEEIKEVSLKAYTELGKGVRSMLCSSGNLYVNNGQEVIVLSDIGEKIASYKLPDSGRVNLIKGNGEKAYVVCYFDDRVEINSIDEMNTQSALKLKTPDVKIFSGNEEHCFIMSNNEGLYGLQADGTTSPIMIWKDCGITVTDVKNIIALPDREYICLDAGGISKLIPVSPSALDKRTELILATVGKANGIKATAANFNRQSREYTVVVKDYSEDGNYDTKTAIKRLNTDIISGKYPDLISFSQLSPFAYINKGYLLDLYKYIDNDSEIKREDIAILKQLEVREGFFYLSNTFNIETLVGLYSEFGDATGWTLDKYLEIEKNRAANAETLYNTTRSQFLRQISARYMRTAVDWDTGECDFDNDMFVSVLEASKSVKETPESTNMANLNTTYGPVRVAEKTLVAAASWVNTVWHLAYEEKMAGGKLSFIGWPTVDGSCGSDIYISAPVGICSQTSSAEGCWEFLKYMLTDVDKDSMGSLPVYMPFLNAKMDNAVQNKPSDAEQKFGAIQITDSDADRFFALLAGIENVALYDETILNIIDEEAGAFFAGDNTAQECARLIQSRTALYVSEQS